ncbi:MAG: glucan biosynthesis protein G [Gammaproteobacteria bacterium]|nr:glucan biosynthesis protein G [Gammaproteobacteria bacterium]
MLWPPRDAMILRLDCAIGCAVLLALAAAGPARAFGFDDVAAKARALAAKPYQPPQQTLPDTLGGLSYDRYRDIRFKQERSIWRGTKLDFEIQLLPPGGLFRTPVRINVVNVAGVHLVHFDPTDFTYGAAKIDPASLKGLWYSGFRIHSPINKPNYKDEVLVFQGASYFRALGRHQIYGLSARGLTVDTGLVAGEEFPRFVEFWIERPAVGQHAIAIDALLDSKRVTGAYRFVLYPGPTTHVDVRARVFLRDYVTKLGIAPLNSMFFYGENQPNHERNDYRPEVHDSDGLQIASGTGEWIWRPLVDPARLLITSFGMTNPQGFGLMQRDREFADYQDLGARYELRPSAWVQPKGNWGSGRVELVEIPTPDETNDDVIAYWVPDISLKPGQPYDFAYRIDWEMDDPTRPPSSWVTQTRLGFGYSPRPPQGVGLVVDFDGPALDKLPADTPVEGVVSADSNGEIVAQRVQPNRAEGGWRLFIHIRRLDNSKPVELRAYLRAGQNTVSETWSYILPPG